MAMPKTNAKKSNSSAPDANGPMPLQRPTDYLIAFSNSIQLKELIWTMIHKLIELLIVTKEAIHIVC